MAVMVAEDTEKLKKKNGAEKVRESEKIEKKKKKEIEEAYLG